MPDIYSPAGQTAASAGTILGGLGAFGGAVSAAIPYIGPVLLGAQLVSSLIGRGRKQADIWAKSVQEPFGKRVAEIIDPTRAAAEAGTLTYDQARRALAQYESEVAALEGAASQFESLGKNQSKVIKQFREQFAGPGYLADWKKSLEGHVQALKPADDSSTTPPPEEAPSVGTILTGGRTPRGEAAKAAAQQRKRSTGLGRSSTILGGAQGRDVLGYTILGGR